MYRPDSKFHFGLVIDHYLHPKRYEKSGPKTGIPIPDLFDKKIFQKQKIVFEEIYCSDEEKFSFFEEEF